MLSEIQIAERSIPSAGILTQAGSNGDAGPIRYAGGLATRHNCSLRLEVDERLLPPWAAGASLQAVFPEVAEQDLKGEILAYFVDCHRAWPAIACHNGQILTNFPLEKTIGYILTEAYLRHPSSLQKAIGRLPSSYQRIPPAWRRTVLNTLIRTRRWRDSPDSFPHWPSDDTADVLNEIFQRCLALTGGAASKSTARWPLGRKFAVALSHDVDTPWCLEGSNDLADIENKYGVRSAWYVVAKHTERPAACKGIMTLVDHGHEIGCHGWQHVPGLPALPPRELQATLRNCLEALGRYATVEGFRAPFLARSPQLYAALESLFLYDATDPDTERFVGGAPNGCCSVLPHVSGKLVQLPLTTAQDALLLGLGFGAEEMYHIWKAKADWIKARGGLVVVSTHPEPQFGARRPVLEAYDRLVRELSQDGEAWLATPAVIAKWWLKQPLS
jgi:peptidoglycan/xylan/chitin deacetylase (PgdA/CDA1 family)